MIWAFLNNRNGSYAPFLGAVLLPIAFGIGVAVDYSNLQNQKDKIQEALDTALMIAVQEPDASRAGAIARRFYASQLPDLPLPKVITRTNGQQRFYFASVNAEIPNQFMRWSKFIGIQNHDTSHVSVKSIALAPAQRFVPNTDSMLIGSVR